MRSLRNAQGHRVYIQLHRGQGISSRKGRVQKQALFPCWLLALTALHCMILRLEIINQQEDSTFYKSKSRAVRQTAKDLTIYPVSLRILGFIKESLHYISRISFKNNNTLSILSLGKIFFFLHSAPSYFKHSHVTLFLKEVFFFCFYFVERVSKKPALIVCWLNFSLYSEHFFILSINFLESYCTWTV